MPHHNAWNPWHGCVKCSPGCANCYMFYLDKKRADIDGGIVHRNGKALFNEPLARTRQGEYKLVAGNRIKTCMTSDFFLEQADEWRPEAWDIIRKRPDLIFFLLTKRPERFAACLPPDWGDGWENVILNVTAENQEMADKRLPVLIQTPAKHRGVVIAPWIGPVSLKPWLMTGLIEQVSGGGENYDGCRVCDFDWVKAMHDECVEARVSFCFYETGTIFRKDGKLYRITSKTRQSQNAYWSNMSVQFPAPGFVLKSPEDGHVLSPEELPKPRYCVHCISCGNRQVCTGCGMERCNECGWGRYDEREMIQNA